MNYFNTQIGFGTADLANNRHSEHWTRDKIAMRHAVEVGYHVFDTAEMYGDGKTETMMGEVLAESGKRDQLHIVSKVLPVNAVSKDSIMASCRASINRMCCDYIDTYLLHWRRPDDLFFAPIIEAFMELQHLGLIKKFGVSNFSRRWMEEWRLVEQQLGSDQFVTNQNHYSVSCRDPEKYYLDWMADNNLTFMAYSPLNNTRNQILNNTRFLNVAEAHGYNPAQLAVAWTIQRPNVIVIPRSADKRHIESNLLATKLKLTTEVLADLDKLFL